MTDPRFTLSCLLLALCGNAAARADDAAGETIVIEDTAPDDKARGRDRALRDAPFVTIIPADEQAGNASVADALATSAGAHVRSLGGLGAYESVSVRGAAPGHTSVLVDGIPLARLAQVTTDLGRFSTSAFGEVELYRGAVPVELGGAGVGGAVNLVTRLGRGEHGERVRASFGAGSHGARHARLSYGDDHGRVLSSTSLGYLGASGDFSYFSDNGTPLNPNDDGYQRRQNNAFDQLELATRLGSEPGELHRAGGVRVVWKRQGLPGSAPQPAFDTTMSTLDVIGDAAFDAELGEAVARQLGYVLVERQVLRDPMAELGLGTQHRGYLTIASGASTSVAIPLGRHRATAGVELRGERFADEDLTGYREPLVGTRAGGGAAIAAELALAPQLVVTPALRFDALRTAPTPMTEGLQAYDAIPPRWDAVPSPRFTALARIVDDVAIKGSAGYYVRLPTLLELFGNRGLVLGAPDLLPERGPSTDVGFVWAPAKARGRFDRIFVEAALFATRSRDTIALVSSAGFIARAENVGDTSSHGAELVVAGRLARALALTASYTRLVTDQRTVDPSFFGKALPRSPGHRLYARASLERQLAKQRAGAWIDIAAESQSFLDRANLQHVPARALVGAGLRCELGRGMAAGIAVANLGDARIVTLPVEHANDIARPMALSDLAGYPLPGRSYYLTFEWTR